MGFMWSRKKSMAGTHLPKVIHLPRDVGGNAQHLSRQMKLLGARSTSLVTRRSYFEYGGDIILSDAGTSRIVLEARKLWAFGYVMRYNVVFFNFGQTLFAPSPLPPGGPSLKGFVRRFYNFYARTMQRLELSILNARGCTLLIQYQGDDARQGDILRRIYSYSHVDEVEEDYYSSEGDRIKRQQIALIAPQCKRVYALNPDLLNVLPERAVFLPYAHIDLNDWVPRYLPRKEGSLRVGHAPTHRAFKGTDYVLRAVQELQEAGHDIQLDLIEGVSNAAARRRYEEVDVLVDQLLCGWYGGVALEAMALGKPVIAYLRKEDFTHLPTELCDQLPIVNADRGTIKDALLHLLQLDSESFTELQVRSRAFVETWHDPSSIAQRILQDVQAPTEEHMSRLP